LMIAGLLSTIVLGLTLTAFSSMQRNAKLVDQQNDTQDVARRATDRIARELRNLASPSQLDSDLSALPAAVDKSTDYDFVFRVVDEVRPGTSLNLANVKRVRYCLNPTTRTLWTQTQLWETAAAPATPATTSCPQTTGATAADWRNGRNRVAASDVVNVLAPSTARPVFLYNSTDPLRITRVRTDLYVDTTLNRKPVASRLRSGVFLRNQNRQPVSSFSATVTADKRLILNGSASEDPEGMPLSYQWYIDPPAPPAVLPNCKTAPTAACLGEGVVLDKSGLPSGNHTIKLVVSDPAQLAGESSKTVTLPS